MTSTEIEWSKPGFAEEALPWMDSVYRFALRMSGGDRDQAGDLTQETFLRAYRHWHTYQPGTGCRSWLFTICRNVFLRSRERADRRPELTQSDLAFDIEAVSAAAVFKDATAADPERVFFDSFVDREVLGAIAELPTDFREAVVLSDLEGLSYAEIADVMGVPVGTVKSRLYRGRRLLEGRLLDYAVEMGYVRAGRKS